MTVQFEPLESPEDFGLAELAVPHSEPFLKCEVLAIISIIQL